jgi:hypothetical protein
VRANERAIEMVRETYRRSGGKTLRLGQAELTALYQSQLSDVHSMEDFRHARVVVDADALVPAEVRARYAALPAAIEIRGREVEIQYDVEEGETGPVGVARLRLPEKLARSLAPEELPTLDRPLRFVVTRGARGAARGSTLSELQDELERPFTPDEIRVMEERWQEREGQRREQKRHHRTQKRRRR